MSESSYLDRRGFLRGCAALGASSALLGLPGCGGGAREERASSQPAAHPALTQLSAAAREIATIDLADCAARLREGRTTSRALVEAYLERIERLDRGGPAIRSLIETLPDPARAAEALDRERSSDGARGPLHGVPILLKDNVATLDGMATSAGSLALLGSRPPQESHAVTRLRNAGALILGKTNLSEWANFRSTRSTSGWSARGGQTRNPHVLDRSPCGSSSGSGAAVAAALCAAAVGSETDGSIVCPASVNGVVAIKPTVGLVSRSGVIPISLSQDTLGPMARTVRDACMLLSAMAGVDPTDPATAAAEGRTLPDYTAALDVDGLRGARIGVARELFQAGSPASICTERALAHLRDAGATLVDVTGIAPPRNVRQAELHVLLCEFKAGTDAYLAALEGDVAVRSLAELIAFNASNREREMPHFGQELLVAADETSGISDLDYAAARALCVAYGEAAIAAVLDRAKLDAWVAPTRGPAWRVDYARGDAAGLSCAPAAAIAGAPHVTVPCGDVRGLPVGLSFVGRRFDEPTVLRLAYAFEQRTHARIEPAYRATVRDA